VGTSAGVGNGYVRYAVNRELIVQAAIVAKDTAMPVGGVLAETDVSDNVEVRKALAQDLDASDDGTLWVVGGGTESVFGPRSERYAEQDDRAQPFIDEGFEKGDQLVDATAALVGKRGNENLLVVLVGDKDGVDEHRLRLVSMNSELP